MTTRISDRRSMTDAWLHTGHPGQDNSQPVKRASDLPNYGLNRRFESFQGYPFQKGSLTYLLSSFCLCVGSKTKGNWMIRALKLITNSQNMVNSGSIPVCSFYRISHDSKFRRPIITITLLYQYVHNESPYCLLATIPILTVLKGYCTISFL